MYLSFLNILFIFTLILGASLAFSSSSWFSIWAGLELNLLAFIPLIVLMNSRYSSEASLKYFLIQALGSSLIIFSSNILMFSSKSFLIIMTSALFLKLGAAPFHFWFVQIMESLSWPQAIILMTIQKMAPLMLLSYLMGSNNIMWMLILFSISSAVIGAFGGMNQMSLRKLMAFSSINHLAWMISSILMSNYLLLIYYSIYCLISSSVALMFFFQQSYHFSHIFNQNNISSFMKILIFLSLLSLGGLPPFTGFFPKWILIQELMNYGFYVLLGTLLFSSLIVLYFYLRVTFSVLMISSYSFKLNIKQNKTFSMLIPMFSFTNLFGLSLPCCFLMF